MGSKQKYVENSDTKPIENTYENIEFKNINENAGNVGSDNMYSTLDPRTRQRIVKGM